MPALSIHLFGPLQVRIDGQSIPRMRARTIEWLLALLILRQGCAVDRTWLAGVLWPDSLESRALHNLRDVLVHLRKALGSQAGRLQSPARDTLTLDLTGADVDLLRFDAAMRAGDDTSLRRAVEVYSGPLLEGCYGEWVLPERQIRAEQCLAALERLAAGAQARGDLVEAVGYLRRAEALEPLREPVLRRLMTCLGAQGDSSGAMEAYRRFRQRLHDEMASAPDRETTLLYQQIRARVRETAHPVPPPLQRSPAGSPPTALSPVETAAPASLPLRPPHPLAALIGREEEVALVCELLGQHRLVTLTGTGGVGKTRLAMEAAGRIVSMSAGRAVWVELAPLTDGALLSSTLAATLGLRSEGLSDAGTLLNHLVDQLSEGAWLLVLDNCEHLLEAAAQMAHRLLSRCAALRVLATSRQRLGLPGEMVWRVPSLSCPPELRTTAQGSLYPPLLDYPAVRLFVERATAVRAGFRLTGRVDEEAVGRICRRLDGIPLALELAAARASLLSIQQIAARLDDRFALLRGGNRAAAPRHQTLQALIDWSYDQLSVRERALLRRLSVFAGGWSLEAAEHVCGFEAEGGRKSRSDPQSDLGTQGSEAGGKMKAERGSATSFILHPSSFVLDLLASLEDRSLVVVEEMGTGLRYRMLETVREYARQKLRESGEEDAVRERHADHYLALAEQAAPFMTQSDLFWLDRLEVEHDNLRAALNWFAAQEERVEKAVRLAAALASFWNTRGHFHEQRTWLVGLAHRPTATTEARARLLADAAMVARSSADLAGARRMCEERLAIYRRLGDRHGIADTLNVLAWIVSDPVEVRSLAEQSLAIMRELGHRQGMAQGCFLMGRLARQAGHHDEARTYLMECRALDAELGIRGGHALPNLGELALEHGDMAEAQHYFTAYLAECREVGNRWGAAWGLRGLATVAQVLGQAERAARLLGAALAMHQALGNTISSEELATYERLRGALSDSLGESALARAWTEGRAMTTELATAYALE